MNRSRIRLNALSSIWDSIISRKCGAASRIQQRRFLTKDPKRFYKSVTISSNDGMFEINLDRRKLKTPMGNLFRVPSEPLALAVAIEWDSQKEVIRQPSMHFTKLCNTAIDDPLRDTKDDQAEGILRYLETDTVCCRAEEPAELVALQSRAWDPVVQWVAKRHDVEIRSSSDLSGPEVPVATKEKIIKLLRSYNSWSLLGLKHAVEALKSLVLTLALVDRHLDVKTAVALSRLEEEFQIAQWGNVEWAHELELQHLQNYISACLLFIQFSLESGVIRDKL